MSSPASPSSTLAAHPSNPTTPAFSDELEWITAYLTAHSLSAPSRRYSFLLWIAVVLVFLTFAILHWTGSRAGVLGAYWSKWSLRRRTWRKKHSLAVARKNNQPHRQPPSLPSNAQLLSLTALLLACLTLAFVGPDYLSPDLKVWQIKTRRGISHLAASPLQQLYDSSTFQPYMPQYTISKSLWSSSARTGQIAFALFPLCVLFALKAPPFAIFAIPFMIQIFFDKLAWLHRWSGRLIWFLTTIHVVLWSVQLARDRNPTTGRLAYVDAWSYEPFIYGWIAFALLTLTIILSIHPIRRNFYEAFYFLHVLLVPLTLIMAAMHHPPIWWWCWAALAGWAGERLWRGTWWIYTNGFVGGMSPKASPPVSSHSKTPSNDTWEMDHIRYLSPETHSLQLPHDTHPIRSPSPLSPYYDKGSISPGGMSPLSAARHPPTYAFPPQRDVPRSIPPLTYIPPPGYAHAELLSGRTIRLRLITPGFLPWSPGQHFLLNVPSVSRFTSHPFTCASVCDEEAPNDEGRIMIFLVRAKNGWTQDLWDLVSRMTAERSLGDMPNFGAESLPKHGVLLRTYVDGPFGSAKRARWGNYSTAVIITGGSGVSFGLSILEYLTLCLAGRDGKHLGGTPGGWGKKLALTRRVRFIWLIREYSHVQWCASLIRRCLAMVSSSSLQVDIYVTNFKPIASQLPFVPTLQIPRRTRFALPEPPSNEELQPPLPRFARDGLTHHHTQSSDSVESHDSYESDVDLSYYTGDYSDDEPSAPDELSFAHETNILELTNFDGDDDTALPGELHLSRSVKKQGKLRRQSRKAGRAGEGKKDATDTWTGLPRTRSPSPSPAAARARRAQRTSTLSAVSTDRLLPISPLSDRRRSALSSDTELVSPVRTFLPYAETPFRTRRPSEATITVGRPTVKLVTPPHMAHGGSTPSSQLSALNSWDGKSEAAGSSRGLVSSSSQTMTVTDASSDRVRLEMDEREAMDVDVVAEHARPGKPKLDKVIADEVEVAKQGVIVACCGPTSLNAMVRKIIAAQIDPGRIRRGDMRGSIALVSEEFEY
ncbi:ferric reductase like transmembrane component-domain-containing protein [Phlebopus sp. FC_14]|nr:ferric reductase like transmembrane component-domain-containing protein [Phlebopus sp. FC_14]